jgi:hypothetical protein
MGWGPRQSISGIKLEGWSAAKPWVAFNLVKAPFAFTLPVVVEQQINVDSK